MLCRARAALTFLSSGQHGWWHCPLPGGNVPQVYGYPTPPQNNTSFSTGSTHTDIMFGAGRQDFNACDPVNNEEPGGNAPGGQEGPHYPLPVHDYPSQHQSDASLSGGSGYFLHRSDLVIRGQETRPTFPLQYRSFESDPAHMEYHSGQNFYLPQGNAPYSNGAPPHREMPPYDSGGSDYTGGGQRMPAIQTKHSDYNHGMAWTTTAIPPAANANLDVAGSLAMQPCPVPSSPTPSQLPESPEAADNGTPGNDTPGVYNVRFQADLGPRGAMKEKVSCPFGCRRYGRYGGPTTFKTIYSLRTHLVKSCKRPVGKPETPQDVYVLAESIWAAAEARAAAEGARAESPS
ncbi:hypothetical protein JB92DRAFT_872617 [Gautieria morchelliformis]|nr:hypothetical protein JB92DRAFT_872617 [Gautieria morchelliformis]